MNEQLVVGGIVLSGIIVGLVELAKALGLPKGWERWLTGILTLAAFIVVRITEFYPQVGGWVTLALGAVAVFLSATGMYHVVAKPIRVWARGE